MIQSTKHLKSVDPKNRIEKYNFTIQEKLFLPNQKLGYIETAPSGSKLKFEELAKQKLDCLISVKNGRICLKWEGIFKFVVLRSNEKRSDHKIDASTLTLDPRWLIADRTQNTTNSKMSVVCHILFK